MKTFQQFLEMQTPVVGGSQPIPSPLSSYDSTGARYTPDQMPEKYQQYKKDIIRVWDFIQAQSVYQFSKVSRIHRCLVFLQKKIEFVDQTAYLF